MSCLTRITDPNLIVGANTCDDAGVYRLTDDIALIQTVDFFTPIVDDPYAFGQIVAANALSDVYAMGGKPLLVMNLVAFPVKDMERSVLTEMLRGGQDKINEAGAILVGGHSIEDKELKYGLSVTGIVHPDKVVLNAGARVGDRLLLTKPIGTGILATALKGGLVEAGTEALITTVMATLNRAAGEAMAEVTVHGATDITGYGLIGHLHEVAAASGVAVRLDARGVPLLPGVADLAAMGIIPAGAYKNRDFYQKWVTSTLVALDPLEMILYDPQTSGGLLISAPQAAIDQIVARLAQCSYPLAVAVVGEVTAGPAGTITVG